MDSGALCHMIGTRAMFLSMTCIDLDMHVVCGTNITHALRGTRYARFQLDSGGYLEGDPHVVGTRGANKSHLRGIFGG